MLEHARRAVAAEPRNPSAHEACGYALLGLDRIDDAVLALREAAGLCDDPDHRRRVQQTVLLVELEQARRRS
jgi:Flp pilus assembly protein TadD